MRSLTEILKKQPPKKIVDEQTVLYVCQKFIEKEYGKRGGEMLQPISWKNGTLYIKARSSVWGNEFLLHKKDVLRTLGKEMGLQEVRDIQIIH